MLQGTSYVVYVGKWKAFFGEIKITEEQTATICWCQDKILTKSKARATLETGCPHTVLSRARARRDTTRQDCFVMIPAHTGVTIVYCGTVVPSCRSQMSARWLSITSRNACEHSVNKSEGDWLLGVLVLRWIALRNGSPGNCSGLCSCSSDTEEENQKTVLGTSHLQLQIVKRKILHPVRKSTLTSH